MEIKTEFNLLQTGSDGALQSVRNGLPSIQAAKDFAQSWAGRETQEFKIQQVTTYRQTIDIFEVEALPPMSLDEIAENMASVYGQNIDWKDEDFLRLSESDKAIVRDIVNAATDDCENCGWTFQSDYLSHTDHGNVCDRCESELEEEESYED
jgi:predicted Zn-ribbon and HTH transcriptional regulator